MALFPNPHTVDPYLFSCLEPMLATVATTAPLQKPPTIYPTRAPNIPAENSTFSGFAMTNGSRKSPNSRPELYSIGPTDPEPSDAVFDKTSAATISGFASWVLIACKSEIGFQR